MLTKPLGHSLILFELTPESLKSEKGSKIKPTPTSNGPILMISVRYMRKVEALCSHEAAFTNYHFGFIVG